jgi:membrane protein required for beta-lactamase induction
MPSKIEQLNPFNIAARAAADAANRNFERNKKELPEVVINVKRRQRFNVMALLVFLVIIYLITKK